MCHHGPLAGYCWPFVGPSPGFRPLPLRDVSLVLSEYICSQVQGSLLFLNLGAFRLLQDKIAGIDKEPTNKHFRQIVEAGRFQSWGAKIELGPNTRISYQRMIKRGLTLGASQLALSAVLRCLSTLEHTWNLC